MFVDQTSEIAAAVSDNETNDPPVQDVSFLNMIIIHNFKLCIYTLCIVESCMHASNKPLLIRLIKKQLYCIYLQFIFENRKQYSLQQSALASHHKGCVN